MEAADIELIRVPEPNTNEMVDLLYKTVDSIVNQIPFPFTNGDLMGALIYLVVEAGLQNGEPEKLRKDIDGAVERVIAQLQMEKAGQGGVH